MPLFVRNRQDDRLDGRARWKGPAKMFDQDAEEPFDGSHQGSMNHDRLVDFPVFSNIAQFEAFRIIEIDLNGRTLP